MEVRVRSRSALPTRRTGETKRLAALLALGTAVAVLVGGLPAPASAVSRVSGVVPVSATSLAPMLTMSTPPGICDPADPPIPPLKIISVSRTSSCRETQVIVHILDRSSGVERGQAKIDVLEWFDLQRNSPIIFHNARMRVVSADPVANQVWEVPESTCGNPIAVGCTVTGTEGPSLLELIAGHTWTGAWTEVWNLDDGEELWSNADGPRSGEKWEDAPYANNAAMGYILEPGSSNPTIRPLSFAIADSAPAVWRCDRLSFKDRATGGGCVNPYAPETVVYDEATQPLVGAVARHVLKAQSLGHAGKPGSGRPLHRNDLAVEAEIRRVVCTGSSPIVGFNCDEYPLATTYEGGAGASEEWVPEKSNSAQGQLMQQFYADWHIRKGDPFYVDPRPLPVSGGGGGGGGGGGPTSTSATVMVVGDSISHGLEDDFTWRFRLYQHAVLHDLDLRFVGDNYGTDRVPDVISDNGPSVPTRNAGYRGGLTFPSQHNARWGRQMHQEIDTITGEVGRHTPDVILVELGFNDLGWNVSSPLGLIDDVKTFIARARAADPGHDVDFVIANVPKRTPLAGFPDLPNIINSYDNGLPPNLAALSTATSTITMANLAGALNPATDSYDGLHPNVQGEYKIAREFANGLNRLGIGPAFDTPAPTDADPTPAAPTSMSATATGLGAKLSWGHVYGAGGYHLYQRDATIGGAWADLPLDIPADSWDVTGLEDGHTYQFKVRTARGLYRSSSESPAASVVAHPTTAPPPSAFTVTPAASSINLSWTRPSGAYTDSINGYRVNWLDSTVGGAVQTRLVSGTSTAITGLVAGHRYELALASINATGEGRLGGANAAIPGAGTPASPPMTARLLALSTVQLNWTTVAAGADYWVLYKRKDSTGDYIRLPLPVIGGTWTIDSLAGGADQYTFCVDATNGTLRSARTTTNCKDAVVSAGLAAGMTVPEVPPALKAPAAGTATAGRSAGALRVVDPMLARAVLARAILSREPGSS
jgi:lysophospholipase L1-like esterase